MLLAFHLSFEREEQRLALYAATVSSGTIDRDGRTLNCFFNADFTQPGYQVAEVTIEVVPGSVDALIALVNSLSLDSGITQSLSAKLQNAKTMLDGGDFNSGCGMLGAFGNEVSAQTGRLIPGPVHPL